MMKFSNKVRQHLGPDAAKLLREDKFYIVLQALP